MPHPKNRLKLTGDTHLPGRDMDLDLDLDHDLDIEEDVAADTLTTEPRVYADGYVPSGSAAMDSADAEAVLPEPEPHGVAAVVDKVEDTAGRQAAKKPWLAIGSAVAIGFLLMKMVKR